MLHRTTWIAIPVLAAVVFGAATGWWGYDQYRQRQALALQAENQYEASFHELVAHVNALETEIGKAIITSDPTAWDNRLRDMWRLSYAAQGDVARLPYGLLPMHNVQQFLSDVAQEANDWLDQGVRPTERAVNKSLQTLYARAHTVSARLAALTDVMAPDRLRWLAVQQALADGKSDNQMVDGFRRLDGEAGTFVESRVRANVQPVAADSFAREPEVDPMTAARRLASFAGVAGPAADWQVQALGQGRQGRTWLVVGQTSGQKRIVGYVTRHGGHVIAFTLSGGQGAAKFDFADAEDRAVAWLRSRGFGPVAVMDGMQYGNVGYYVCSPTVHGDPVVDRQLSVKVSLADLRVIGFAQAGDVGKPVLPLPPRTLTDEQIRRRLNPVFRVEMMRDVIVKDAKGRYQPAVAVYGTYDGETYRMYIDARTGRELETDRLTDRTV
ncbi:germination protein YpeB [Alicyclobacillus cellulosilyticus]|uniref:Germination protein YpeB n=1 Tax=Alicyclobacillus cellulosilyticus TaxID=1003997 RepID=A0A917KEC8_9BACL|nr:PepSY1/2 domain-containing protein [Alicyclobacillus cellulosilyticus]GGJ10289.1 germination protein YpeB [Alicyclobacillus cellulosilyticus]